MKGEAAQVREGNPIRQKMEKKERKKEFKKDIFVAAVTIATSPRLSLSNDRRDDEFASEKYRQIQAVRMLTEFCTSQMDSKFPLCWK